MAQSVQMNFRIDAAVKSAGDRTLRECGMKASSVVRSAWEYLARNRHVPGAAQRLMEFLESDGKACGQAVECRDEGEGASARSAEQVVMAGPNLILRFYERVGVNPDQIEPRPYDEMKREAYASKYSELA